MNELLCSICFFSFDDNEYKYTCILKCSTLVCGECMDQLIKYSMNNNLLPTCPSKNCNGIYIISQLNNLPAETIKNYEFACFNNFLKSKGDNVKKKIEQEKIVKRIREDRLKFIETTYPKSISLVANIVFKNKLRKLDKQKEKIINLKLKSSSKSCLNITCNGFLDPDYVCMTCLTEFCEQCEKKIYNKHECKQEDLDSVNLVNNLTHCPTCNLPIFKNEGCDSITCANCNTNFLYSTGKKGGHGSYNTKIDIKVNNAQNLSVYLNDKISTDCLELILNLEALKPKFISKDTLLKPIKIYYKTNNKKQCSKLLAIKLDKYTKYKYKIKEYYKYLVEIENMIKLKEDSNKLKERLCEIIEII